MSVPSESSLVGRTVAVLGCGSVGAAFATASLRAGARVRLFARDLGAARNLAAAIPTALPADALMTPRAGAGIDAHALGDLDLATAGEVLLFCVTERALRELAAELALRAGPLVEPPVALHSAGFLGTEPLAPLRARGLALGKLHPLHAFPPGEIATSLAGVWFALAGDDAARRAARDLVRAFGGRELALIEDDEALPASERYHTAASLLAGGLVALFALAEELMPAERADARQALGALAARTLENVVARGPTAALTGPVARGEAELLSRQLEVLEARAPEAAVAYRSLARRMLSLALSRGSLTPDVARTLEDRLES